MEKGVPAEEIAFIHDAATETQRQALFERMRKGEVRVLLGSTSKLGTGVNVQDKVIAINHLDCPWKPSDITQRNGRGIRQGNENPEVMVKQFVTKGTFDAYLWQIQEQKLRYITQIMTGRSIARSCEDVDETVLSAAQFKAAATDNPLLVEKMELENRVTELKILRSNWQNEQYALDRSITKTYPAQIARHEKEIEEISRDMEVLKQTDGAEFSIALDGRAYTERPEAGHAFGLLYRAAKEMPDRKEKDIEIGAYRGFSLYLRFQIFGEEIVIKGAHSYSSEIGQSAQGAITRIENLAGRMERYLEDAKRGLADVKRQMESATQQAGQPFAYEQELSEKAAKLTEINLKLEFKSLQEDEPVLDENGQRTGGGESRDMNRGSPSPDAEL